MPILNNNYFLFVCLHLGFDENEEKNIDSTRYWYSHELRKSVLPSLGNIGRPRYNRGIYTLLRKHKV